MTGQEGGLTVRTAGGQDVGEGSCRRSKDRRNIDAGQPEVVRADARESGLVTAGDFVGKVIVGLIFLNRPTEGHASLHASVGGIGRSAEGIDGLEIAITQISIDVAVKVVGSGAGDDVDYAARGAAVFGGVVVGDDLEFLHGFLRDGGAHAVGGVVGGVGAVDIDQIGTGALAAHVEAGSGRGAKLGSAVALHLRIGQRELDVVAAVDGQIIDAAFADGVGGGTARSFHDIGLGADLDDFLASGDAEGDG